MRSSSSDSEDEFDNSGDFDEEGGGSSKEASYDPDFDN